MKQMMMRLGLSLFGLVVATVAMSGSASAWSNSHMMDDAIFDNVNSMTEQQIRDFINSRPGTCLVTSGAVFPEPITYWQYGGNVDAARVIYNAARYNDINPQVILATLQKEQSLITRTNCFSGSIDVRMKAMGQGCPDGGACPVPAYAGLHQQVMKGAWQLKFNKERANGNVNWGDNGSIVYGGPWTQGNRAACSTCTSVYRDGYWNVDGQSLIMETGATAAFYRYTPHLGQALPGIFEGWFGPTLVPTFASAYAGQSTYPTLVGGQSTTAYLMYRNAGNQAWYDDTSATAAGKNPVHLATSHNINRTSTLGGTWGGDKNRAALNFAAVYEANGTTLASNQHVVQPGQVAKFSFVLSTGILTKPGMYREFFQPIVEGQTIMNDPWTFLDITVQAATFASQYAGQSEYPTILQGTQATAYFVYKNVGNQPWYDDASASGAGALPIHLATSHDLNRSSAVGDIWGGSRSRSALNFAAVYEANGTLASNQHVAQPGQMVKFSFPVSAAANLAPGLYREFFQPIVEGTSNGNMNDPWTFIDVTVKPAVYSSAYAGQSVYPTINQGQQTTAYFIYTNNGTMPWYDQTTASAAGKNPVRLATSHGIDRSSVLGSTWGGSQNRATGTFAAVYEANGTLASNQHVAQPGQMVKFDFVLSAASGQAPGVYREFFQPVVDGQTAMNDPWTFLDVTVQGPVYTSAYFGQSAYPTVSRGQTANGWFMYKNTGNQPWYDDTTASGAGKSPVHLATSHNLSRASALGGSWSGGNTRAAGTFAAVYEANGTTLASSQHVAQPGQIVRFNIAFAAPSNAATGIYREFFQPIVEGGTAMNDPWTFLDVNVQ